MTNFACRKITVIYLEKKKWFYMFNTLIQVDNFFLESRVKMYIYILSRETQKYNIYECNNIVRKEK